MFFSDNSELEEPVLSAGCVLKRLLNEITLVGLDEITQIWVSWPLSHRLLTCLAFLGAALRLREVNEEGRELLFVRTSQEEGATMETMRKGRAAVTT